MSFQPHQNRHINLNSLGDFLAPGFENADLHFKPFEHFLVVNYLHDSLRYFIENDSHRAGITLLQVVLNKNECQSSLSLPAIIRDHMDMRKLVFC